MECSTYNNPATPANGYVHKRIQHAQNIYVMGDAHTNSIEGLWRLVRFGIGWVYHSVSWRYLQTYLDEYAFRYNRRDSNEPMFVPLLGQVSARVD